MHRVALALLFASLVPAAAYAAPSSFRVAQSLVAASSSPGNAYAAGVSVVLTAPVSGDFSALGGSIIAAAPVTGDDLLVGGSVASRAPVAGDLRALGAHVDITQPVGGDLVAAGYSVTDDHSVAGTVFILAGNTTLSGGAEGPVTIYGNNVVLAGEFAQNVRIIASGRVSLAPNTVIHGALSYDSPETATIPDSVRILGGVTYTNPSYLPDVGTSRILALLSIGFFLIARILGGLILAGLLAGLFPQFAETLTDRVVQERMRSTLLSFLLGLAVVVATPIVIALLMLTFVGAGIAILLFILYALLLALALLYAAIVGGAILMRRVRGRTQVKWHDGVVGMLLLSAILFIPILGPIVVGLLTFSVAGVLLQRFFEFAFPHDSAL